jgi:hypothetical protein
LAVVGVGYAIKRLARFVLNDPDWNNMFASKDRQHAIGLRKAGPRQLNL